ncbi:bifunctional metallophosphatase/5'-nucleotidase [Nocardioides turkmenicus]|uniref:bifunctional metallophosphatase/5'-nucleotidase n=1 Tax=Nocardioides turkmenicus TaxID=2711220 RepID=UPI0019D152B4|nr:bifunctional metallophosphatase/5'-nucleotidase [Nocardioides sp. KC13]
MPRNTRKLRPAVAVAAVALAAAAVATPVATSASAQPDSARKHLVDVQLLSFNDFHGNLEAPSGSSGRLITGHHIDPATGKPVDDTVNVGGVEYLASHLAEARKGHDRSLTVAAGDLIGASPLLSAAFHDEPSIEALNKLGLDVTAVGNHEFDEGYKELQRIDAGGCIDDGDGKDNQNSCAAHEYQGADFDILASNVIEDASGKTILPAYSIKELDGVKIGFIGMTLEATPDIVTAEGVKGLTFKDEVETANALVPVLKKKGVKAIVTLIHEGANLPKEKWTDPATGKVYEVNARYDYTCEGGGELVAGSPIVPIAQNLHPEIDMVVTGHTHNPYVCDVPDPDGKSRLITSASSFGRLYTETNLKYDLKSRDIVRSSVKGSNLLVTRDIAKAPEQTTLINTYKELVKPIASRVLGSITTDVKRDQSPAGESALGDLIADAQLADQSTVVDGQVPVIAFMNPGGIRADLTAANSPYGEAVGDVTYDEAFTVQPFNNYLVSLTMTGQDIYDLLTQQVAGANASSHKILQVSKGFTYQISPSGPVDGSVMLNGQPIDKAASYRVVTNNFLQGGGDAFAAFTKGTDPYYGGLDIDAFSAYLEANSPYTPGPLDRITGTH